MGLDNAYGIGSLKPGVCTSTTRPGSPFDGQLIYETDTDRVAVYDATAWVYKTPASTTGSILQVVSTTKTDTYTHSAGRTFSSVTGLTASITPRFSTSKIYVTVSIMVGANNGGTWLRLTGGNTASSYGATAGSRILITTTQGFTGPTQVSMQYLDSPATTSAITYGVDIAASDNVTTTYVNRSVTDTDNNTFYRSSSTITVMEVAQ